MSTRLREEMGRTLTPVAWDGRKRGFVLRDGRRVVKFTAADWLLTVELFCEAERPGFREFAAASSCRLAAVFHDAIPLRWPHITWPQSVQRHPEYMKLLAGFDRVWAVSKASRRDLVEFWRWQGVVPRAEVATIGLGADFDGGARVARSSADTAGRAALLCVGIIEPRKNQEFILEVCTALWRDGLDFDLHVVGRVNPHFGEPMVRRLRAVQKGEPRLHLWAAVGDVELRSLYGAVRAVVFPTLAEGCGLPLLEALWRGVPCVGSDLPALRENAAGGGCLLARVNDAADWREKLRTVLTEPAALLRLQQAAAGRPLPRWADTARTLLDGLG
ncbi:MAG: glycosyltransferase [Opitutales bacterium]